MSSTGGRDQPRMNTNGHESVTPQAALQLLFLGSLHDSSIAHWGHERRLLARSPGFSRPDVLPPEGRTPCKSRFMENLDDLRTAHWDHEPGRDTLPRVLADRQVGPTRSYGEMAAKPVGSIRRYALETVAGEKVENESAATCPADSALKTQLSARPA